MSILKSQIDNTRQMAHDLVFDIVRTTLKWWFQMVLLVLMQQIQRAFVGCSSFKQTKIVGFTEKLYCCYYTK